MTPLRVFVVAEPRVYREGLTLILRDGCHVEVVGSAADGRVACAQVIALNPDIVVVDMNSAHAGTVLRSIAQLESNTKVVALGTLAGDESVIACLEAGADGYLPPDGSLSELGDCIRSAARGEMSCSPRITAQLARRVASLSASRPREAHVARLTSREAEILDLIDNGLSNKQIARHLCIEVPTVKSHVHNILEKLGVARRGEAAARARRQALATRDAGH